MSLSPMIQRIITSSPKNLLLEIRNEIDHEIEYLEWQEKKRCNSCKYYDGTDRNNDLIRVFCRRFAGEQVFKDKWRCSEYEEEVIL